MRNIDKLITSIRKSKPNSHKKTVKTDENISTLSEMSEEVKIAYLKIVINMADSDDNKIDEKKLAALLMLMTRLELSPESRFHIREYIANETKLESLEGLLAILKKESPEKQYKSVRLSLVKDLISIYMNGTDRTLKKFEFLNTNKALFGITEEEIELAIKSIKMDFKIFDDDYTDNALKKDIKELMAKSTAIGVPLTAVYLSGSVIGMSAAGITSGLSALGLGGILSFSSMVTGIGVVVLLGITSYKGMRHLTGADEFNKVQHRELMLVHIIKQTQSTISLLIEDINYITGILNDLILESGVQEAKIKKIMNLVATMTGAASILNKKHETALQSSLKLHCPRYLDTNKLHSLTNEPKKESLFVFISGFYQDESYSEEKTGNKETRRHKRIENIESKDLEKLINAFEYIGYFKVTEVLKGQAGDVVYKAKGRLAEVFSNEK